jgi:hypothetical protein
MAIAFVQESTNAASGGTTTATPSISPTAGNALVVFITQSASGTRTYAPTDNIEGATGWTEAAYLNSSGTANVWFKANVPAGITTVTITASAAVTFTAAVAEFSGFGTTITVDDSDTLLEGSSSNNHTCSTSGVSSGNEVLSVCAAVMSAAGTECNPGSGYTEVPNPLSQSQTLKQWKRFATGCTNEVGAWSNTGTARIGKSVIALLSGNAGGGGTTYTSTLNETVTLTDALSRVTSKAISETLTYTDSLARSTTKVLSGAFTNTDSLIRSTTKVLSDTLTHTDTVTLIKAVFLTLSETLTYTDTLVRQTTKLLSEALTYTESLIRRTIKVLTETVTYTDVLTAVKAIFLTLSETVTYTDTLARRTTKALLETLTYTNTLIRAVAKTFTETITWTDVVTVASSAVSALWTNLTRITGGSSNQTKHTGSSSNQTKHTGSSTNQTKHTS